MDSLRAPERWVTSEDEIAVELRPALRMARSAAPSAVAQAQMWSSLAAKVAALPAASASLAPGASMLGATVTTTSSLSTAWWIALSAIIAATLGYGAARLTSPATVPASPGDRTTSRATAPSSVEAAHPVGHDAPSQPRSSAIVVRNASGESHVSSPDDGKVPAAGSLSAVVDLPVEARDASRASTAYVRTKIAVSRAVSPRLRVEPSASASLRAPASPAVSPQRSPTPTDFTAELDLLARARRVVAGAPERALQLTAEHARRFPTGVLAQEREVLAIDALSRLGQPDLAAMRARRFMEKYPDSAHRVRLEAALRPSE